MLNIDTDDIQAIVDCQPKMLNIASVAIEREKKTAQIGLRVTPQMKAAIDEIAVAEDRKASWVINKTLEWLLLGAPQPSFIPQSPAGPFGEDRELAAAWAALTDEGRQTIREQVLGMADMVREQPPEDSPPAKPSSPGARSGRTRRA